MTCGERQLRYRLMLAAALLWGATLSVEGADSGGSVSEQAVVIHFNYGILRAGDQKPDLQPLFELERRLEKAIADAKAGEYDGNEIAVSGKDGSLYMYGPDADRLYEAVRPILEAVPFMKGAKVKKRYGPPK